MGLQVPQQALLVIVPADPEPRDRIALQLPESPVTPCHSRRVYGLLVMNPPEPKARMSRVCREPLVGFLGLLLNIRGKLAVRRPEAARRT